MSLIGRSDVIEECVGDLSDGRSVLIVGGRGIGKTTLLDAVARYLCEGPSPVARISGADGASDVPRNLRYSDGHGGEGGS